MSFPVVGYLLIFLVIGAGFVFINLLVGKLFRPERPHEEKATIYECGEPTIGSAWVQFDLRYYVIALLFVIFDVEVAFFFPWAVVFGKANAIAKHETIPQDMSERLKLEENIKGLVPGYQQGSLTAELVERQSKAAGTLSVMALVDILIFFGVLLVGFAYLWSQGDLAWVRAVEEPPPTQQQLITAAGQEPAAVGS